MRPTPFQIFCAYYLGLDLEFRYKFLNLNAVARMFGLTVYELRNLMDHYYLSPELTRHVNYNLASAHATAQELSQTKGRFEVERYAIKCWEEFRQALDRTYDHKKDFENIDYDNIVPGQKRDDESTATD